MNVIKVKNKDYLDKYDINLIRQRLLFWPLGGVVTQRPAKPWTPVRIWQWPPYKFMGNTPFNSIIIKIIAYCLE